MDKKSKKQLLDNIDSLSLNTTNDDVKMSVEFLKNMGIDPDEESEFGLKEIQRAYFLAKAHTNQERDKTLLEVVQMKLRESIERNAVLAGKILENALVQNRASFQFRNIENWTEDEMREVLTDLDLTRLLEELDKME